MIKLLITSLWKDKSLGPAGLQAEEVFHVNYGAPVGAHYSAGTVNLAKTGPPEIHL